jgi:hypothetical protein
MRIVTQVIRSLPCSMELHEKLMKAKPRVDATMDEWALAQGDSQHEKEVCRSIDRPDLFFRLVPCALRGLLTT